ncbi:MAG: hypothetical protein U9O87_00505 [Verrucomicrobiota bacterium]|nr:hypothetical protein [Verrucomicrobiota bacterium]
MKRIFVLTVLVAILVVVTNLNAMGQCCGSKGGKARLKKVAKPQITCPLMGGKINKSKYADVK